MTETETQEIKEYSKTEAALGELRGELAGKEYNVTTPAGMREAKADRSKVTKLRTGLEKLRKEIKAPALEYTRAIDAEAKRITAALIELEEPIDKTIKAEEQREQREKEEAERKERERIAKIDDAVHELVNLPGKMIGRSVAELRTTAQEYRDKKPTEELFGERLNEATFQWENAIKLLDQMADEKETREAEKAELEKLRAEQRQNAQKPEEKIAPEPARADQSQFSDLQKSKMGFLSPTPRKDQAPDAKSCQPVRPAESDQGADPAPAVLVKLRKSLQRRQHDRITLENKERMSKGDHDELSKLRADELTLEREIAKGERTYRVDLLKRAGARLEKSGNEGLARVIREELQSAGDMK